MYACTGHPQEEHVSLVEARKGKVRHGTLTEESAAINEYFQLNLTVMYTPRQYTLWIVR